MNSKKSQVEMEEDEAALEGEVLAEEAESLEDSAADEAAIDEAINDLMGDDDAPASLESLAAEIIALREENADLKDRFTRAKAETDNTRRISAKEVEKARKFALENFAKEMLSVKDSLDQAAQVDLNKGENAQLLEQMSEGLGLTLKQLDSVFERFKLEAVSPETGDALDAELHQAMTLQPSDEVDANNIISTIQVGYTLNERLLRPAMVIVSSGAAK